MGFAINIIFFGIAFVTLAIAGGFATNAAIRVTQIPAWSKNNDLAAAHKYLTIAAVITWISIAIMIVLIILFLIFGLETAAIPGVLTILTYLFLFGTLVLIGAVGILSAIAAAKIGDSKVPDNKGSREQAIIAAVLAIVGAVGMLVVILVRLFYNPKSDEKKKADKEKAQADELKLSLAFKKIQDAQKAKKIKAAEAAKEAATPDTQTITISTPPKKPVSAAPSSQTTQTTNLESALERLIGKQKTK